MCPTLSFSQTKIDITEQMVNSTTRIEAFRDTIIKGVKRQIINTGTGFFFEFSIKGYKIPAIVTNAHVIKMSQKGILRFTEMGADSLPKYGSIVSVEVSNFESKWLIHPTQDLAILLMGDIRRNELVLGKKIFYRTFLETQIGSDTFLNSLTSIEDVLMIGYPRGLYDTKNNLPIVRKGITATPLNINYEGTPKFLLDIPVFPGSSGSPIILFNQGSYSNKYGGITVGTRLSLLGINAQSYNFPIQGELISNGPTQQYTSTKVPIDIAIVIKASELLKFKPAIETYINSKK